LQTTSFANRQPDPAFQVPETAIFTPDFYKASLAAIRFIRLATKPALTSTPVLFAKARAVAEKLSAPCSRLSGFFPCQSVYRISSHVLGHI
jgi:hypothetical protein